MQEPTDDELDRAGSIWQNLRGMNTRRAVWELAKIMALREGLAFQHGVIEGRRYPQGHVLNPYADVSEVAPDGR